MSISRADIVITNGRLVRRSGAALRAVEGSLIISDGRIAALAPPSADNLPPAQLVIDAEGGLVLPGLVNAHTHSPENLSCGEAERAGFDDWMTTVWSRLDRLDRKGSRLAALLGAAEMIRTGVTGVVDHLRRFPMTEATLDAVVGAYAGAGMRTCVPVMLRDAVDSGGRGIDSAHLGALPSPDEQIGIIRNAAPEAARRGVRLALGPSAPHRCSDAMLDAIGAAAEREGFAIHTHVDETPAIAQAARERFGRSTVEELDARGLLGPFAALAHCVAISGDDRCLIARRSALVVHNPLANMRLASGTCDVPALLAEGAIIALGTDGAASNDGQNLWESAKLAALLTRRPGLAPGRWLDAASAFNMATLNGERALRGGLDLEAQNGLFVGAPADLAIYAPDILPHDDTTVAARLVLGSTARAARHVVCAGRVLMRDGQLTTIDEKSLRADLADYTPGARYAD